jgi:hypothetical protein
MGHPNTKLYFKGAKSDHQMTRLSNLTRTHYPGLNLSEGNEPTERLELELRLFICLSSLHNSNISYFYLLGRKNFSKYRTKQKKPGAKFF